MNVKSRAKQRAQSVVAAFVCHLLVTTAVDAAPPIRTGDNNRVPSCVSPERLMAFLRDRNESLDPRYRDIARWYKYYGEAWRVRWDYAFFQMVLETNYLKYRRGNGRRGDVHERQNNFAGIGATGGGVAGERFTDIKTGVHAQIQHLVAYSGERVRDPVAKRTSENQDDIIAKSLRLRRSVTFGDLARRWAADRAYARSIDIVAKFFNEGYCKGPATADIGPPPAPKPARRFEHPSALGGPNTQGAEVLPWTAGSAPRRSTDGKDAIAIKRPAAPRQATSSLVKQTTPPPPLGHDGRPPVRTLWTREDGYEPTVPARMAPTEPVAPPGGAPPALRPSEVALEQARPAGTLQHGDDNRQHASAGSSDAVGLPHFRIAPAGAEPSFLGGPDAAVATTADVREDAHLRGEAGRTDRLATSTIAAAEPHAPSGDCLILSASYGGHKTLLVQADTGGAMQLTALTVLDGFEESMLASYAKARAPGARVIGTFQTKDDALVEARSICPSG